MKFRFKLKYLYFLLIFPLFFIGSLIRSATYPNCLLIEDQDLCYDEDGGPAQIMCRHTRPLVLKGKGRFLSVKIKFLARYKIKGLVVARQLSGDAISWLSAADVGIAWGKMADPEVNQYMRYSQRGRWLYYHPQRGLPVSSHYMQLHTSNTHVLTDSNSMMNVVKNLEPGDNIVFDGYLVKVSSKMKRGFSLPWKSSLTRKDTGNGACEIMYIERIWVNGYFYD